MLYHEEHDQKNSWLPCRVGLNLPVEQRLHHIVWYISKQSFFGFLLKTKFYSTLLKKNKTTKTKATQITFNYEQETMTICIFITILIPQKWIFKPLGNYYLIYFHIT